MFFFDVDHTLWDYDANAGETLRELYDKYELQERGDFTKQELVSTFLAVNEQLWDDYNHQRIQKGYIREQRFKIIFDRLRVPLSKFPYGLGEEYLTTCPTKSNTMAGAIEILEYLKRRYILHVITNGFQDIQSTKLASSGLDQYFDVVVTSESTGARKPSPEIFDHAVNTAKANVEESIMIGDNLRADILGAKSYGLDQIFYNPDKQNHQESVTYEVHHLQEITEIL